jgi:hypothetical protein
LKNGSIEKKTLPLRRNILNQMPKGMLQQALGNQGLIWSCSSRCSTSMIQAKRKYEEQLSLEFALRGAEK